MAVLYDHLWEDRWSPGLFFLLDPTKVDASNVGEATRGWRDNPELRREFTDCRSRIANSEVFVADNVCDYYYATGVRDHFDVADFPCAAPPYSSFWIEMKMPCLLARRNQPGAWASERSYAERWGYLFEAFDRDTMSRAPWDPFERYTGKPLEPECRWVYLATLILEGHGAGVVGPVAMALLAIDGRGGVLRHVILPPKHGNLVEDYNLSAIDGVVKQSLSPALLTICFLNCKNVTTGVAPGPAGQNRQRRKRGQRPLVRYKTLDIGPIREILRAAVAVGDGTGLKRALHLRRGHFKVYTEERKLFNKVAGTFWSPPTLVGRASEGIVIKDYNVNPTPGAVRP